uniref:C-type lectin domain-containing protein n=1 Tax=Clytia hemisphaerica TaxID=252671 RepID=A0A7M5V9J2_9CNID
TSMKIKLLISFQGVDSHMYRRKTTKIFFDKYQIILGGQQQSCQDFISTGDGAGVTGGKWSCNHPTGKPYYFSDDRNDFDTVRAECQALPPFNGRPFDVVVIETKEELDFIVNNPKYTDMDRYIGLTAETLSNPAVPSDFKWINGAPLTLDIFFDDLPSFSDSVPRCVELDRSPIKLQPQSCGFNENVICEV